MSTSASAVNVLLDSGAVARFAYERDAYLTELDYHDHVAWGAIDGDNPIAIGRFIRFDDDPTAADFAITVFDTHQGRSIGPMLLEILAVGHPAVPPPPTPREATTAWKRAASQPGREKILSPRGVLG